MADGAPDGRSRVRAALPWLASILLVTVPAVALGRFVLTGSAAAGLALLGWWLQRRAHPFAAHHAARAALACAAITLLVPGATAVVSSAWSAAYPWERLLEPPLVHLVRASLLLVALPILAPFVGLAIALRGGAIMVRTRRDPTG